MSKHVEYVPFINGPEDLPQYIEPLYVIEGIIADEETYVEMFETLYDVLKGCFHIKECREYPVVFKFYREDTDSHTVQFRHFIINLILWYPFLAINTIRFMDAEIIMDGNKIISDPEYDLTDFINYKIIQTLRSYNVKDIIVERSISTMNHNLRRISIDFSDIMNLNFSFFTIYKKYKENARVREIMESKFPDKSEPRALELAADAMQNELIDILKSDKTDPIGVILRSNTGIKTKQLAEFLIAQMYKPTIDGQVIPIPIENSTMIRGLNKPSYLYIDANAARKSLIMNKTVMGKAGNFGKLVLQLSRTLSLSKTVTDCDTKHFVPITIRSKKHLNKLNQRFYRLSPDDEFQVLDVRKDKHLIGTTVEFRSPATCALGDCVCQKCFGKNASINYELADGLPAFESEEVTKEVNQNVLSTKHLMTTKSEVITFNDAFYKYFTLYAGEVYPNVDNNDNIDDPRDYAIWIDPDSVEKVSDLDSDSSYNTYIATGVFYVENVKTHEREEIKLLHEKEMFLSDSIISLWNSKKRKDGYIYFNELDDSDRIIEMSILNDELTKPLYNMMKLFNNEKYSPNTVGEAVQKFLDILVDSGIAASSVAGECIINRLVRSKERIYERPDFTEEDIEPYHITTVAYCLKCNASPTLGLATQYLKMQLLSPEITKRNGTSYVDPFMQIKVPNLYELYGNMKTLAQLED